MDHLPKLLVGLVDPRKILCAAVLVAVAGVLVGYADVQDRADRELALRQGPPPPVVIQDFRPGTDEGPAREVRLHGEIDMEAAVTLPLRGTKPREWVMVAPVYPVSALGAAVLAEGATDAEGVLAAQAERRIAGTPRVDAPAIGLVVAPMPDKDAAMVPLEGLAEAVLGAGDHGTVVTLDGFAFEPGPLTLMAHGALAARGVLLSESFVAMKPFLAGRDAALIAPLPREQKNELFVLAFALAALAGLLHLLNRMRADAGPVPLDEDEDEIDFVPPPPSAHPKFTPLPSQGEIRAADRVAAEQRSVSVLSDCRFLCQIVTGIRKRVFGWGSDQAVRSPRSPLEDEAL